MKNFIFVVMKGQQAPCQPFGRAPPCSSVQQASLLIPSGSLQTADRKAKSTRLQVIDTVSQATKTVKAAISSERMLAPTEVKSAQLETTFCHSQPVIPVSDGGGGNSGASSVLTKP